MKYYIYMYTSKMHNQAIFHPVFVHKVLFIKYGKENFDC